MATTLRVTPEVAKAKAAELQAKSQEINNITTQIKAIVDTFSGRVWSGEADTTFVNNYNSLHSEVDQLVKMINDNATNLNQIAANYGTAEGGNVQRASVLDKNFL